MPTPRPKADTPVQTAPAPAPSPAVPPTPLEVTNPAGPREGVEQPSGPPEGHDTPVGTDTTQPTAAEVVDQTLENSTEEGPQPPRLPRTSGEVIVPGGVHDALWRLDGYLRTHHADDVVETEYAPDTAVRLLTRLSAKGTAVPRCTAAYCNLPAGHTEQHGWVHVEPGTNR